MTKTFCFLNSFLGGGGRGKFSLQFVEVFLFCNLQFLNPTKLLSLGEVFELRQDAAVEIF